MVRTTTSYYCDVCGKEIDKMELLKECRLSLPVVKVNPLYPRKEERLNLEDICLDCYEAIEDTLAAIMKKTNQEV